MDLFGNNPPSGAAVLVLCALQSRLLPCACLRVPGIRPVQMHHQYSRFKLPRACIEQDVQLPTLLILPELPHSVSRTTVCHRGV